jgi:hypothetical protein
VRFPKASGGDRCQSITCSVTVEGQNTPLGDFAFSDVPREGEHVVIRSGAGGSDMFRVVYVVHFAMDASPDQPSSAIQLTVSRDLKLRADPR